VTSNRAPGCEHGSTEEHRNPQLDGLRAFAAVAVAVYHTTLEMDPSQVRRILAVDFWSLSSAYDKADKVVLSIWNGQTAVAVFFVLSGAVLFNALQRREVAPLMGSIDFTIRRLFRIFPALFVCLAAFTLVVVIMGGRPSAAQFWENAFLFDNPIQGESWTLQVEILAIPFILISFYCYRAFGIGAIVGVYLATWILFKIPLLDPLISHQRTYTICFVLGFLIPTSIGSGVAGKISSRAWPLIVFTTLGARHLIPNRFLSFNTDLFSLGLLFGSSGLLVAILYHRKAGSLGKFLQQPIAAGLGRMSYSFYLYNVIFIRILSVILFRHVSTKAHPIEWGLFLSLFVVALTFPVARLSERFVERPFVLLGRRVLRS
jgi:peptidoglycan/LPS O-acetylase OafA/YrhL